MGVWSGTMEVIPHAVLGMHSEDVKGGSVS